MTHKSITSEIRRKNGVADSLIRLSVGLEEVEDLIADLQQAFEKSSDVQQKNNELVFDQQALLTTINN